MVKLTLALLASGCVAALVWTADAEPRRPKLPQSMAVPQPKPAPEAGTEVTSEAARKGSDAGATEEIPIPEPRPAEPSDGEAGTDGSTPGVEVEEKPRESTGRHNAKNFTPRVDDEAQRAEQSCQQRLRQLGVTFEVRAPLSDAQGCSLPTPLSVSTLGSNISLEPAGLMNCAMTEAAASFAQSVISPTAKAVYGSELKAVANASAYVCRPRNGTSKLSEHAFGNALDMARFVLADGTAIDVMATSDAKAVRFLGDIRKAACGPFKTVLGPGSDADHATHFHVDLAARRNGATFCQ